MLERAVRLVAAGSDVPVAELAAVSDALGHVVSQGSADPANVRVEAEIFECRSGDAGGQEAHGCSDGAQVVGMGRV